MDSPQGLAAVDSPTTRLRLTSTKTEGTPTDGSALPASIAASSPNAPASATSPPTRAVLAMRVLLLGDRSVAVAVRDGPAAHLERAFLIEQRLELAVRVDHHRRLEAVHAPEPAAGLHVAAADDEEVELAAPGLAHLVQARDQLAAREAAGRREDEHPRDWRQLGECDRLAGVRVRGDELGRLDAALEADVRDQRTGIVAEAQLDQAELPERAREQEREGEHDEPQDDVRREPDSAHRRSIGWRGTSSGWCRKLTRRVGVGCMDAFVVRNDQARGKRPESRVMATNAAVIRSDGRSASR